MAKRRPRASGRIFISYRREETAYPAGWLFDRLADEYGGDQVFKDVDSIELGDDFGEVITDAVGSTDVLLALIGNKWLTITDEDLRRRLDNPDDFVRLEIEAALARKVRVIPILVDGARMPRADELPPSLAPLARRQALELSPSRFAFDTSRLLKVLNRTLAEARMIDDAASVVAPAAHPSVEVDDTLHESARPRRTRTRAVQPGTRATPGWRRLISTRWRLLGGLGIAAVFVAVLFVGIVAVSDGGGAVFEDDFSSRESGWDDSGTKRNGGHYTNGTYRIYADDEINAGTEVGTPKNATSVYPSALPNIRVKVDARKLAGPEREGGYGIVCRADARSDYGYAFTIWGTDVSLVKYFEADPGYSILRERFGIRAVNATGVNEVEAVCASDEAQEAVNHVLSVTGQRLLAYTDADDPFLSGTVGLVVTADGAMEAEFDNFVVDRY
jgi:hypothetical protein